MRPTTGNGASCHNTVPLTRDRGVGKALCLARSRRALTACRAAACTNWPAMGRRAILLAALCGGAQAFAGGVAQLRAQTLFPTPAGSDAFRLSAMRLPLRSNTAVHENEKSAAVRSCSARMAPDANDAGNSHASSCGTGLGDGSLRLAKVQKYAQVFRDEGATGDMLKYSVVKVAEGDADAAVSVQDRLTKAARYAALFALDMTGANRVVEARRIYEDQT